MFFSFDFINGDRVASEPMEKDGVWRWIYRVVRELRAATTVADPLPPNFAFKPTLPGDGTRGEAGKFLIPLPTNFAYMDARCRAAARGDAITEPSPMRCCGARARPLSTRW